MMKFALFFLFVFQTLFLIECSSSKNAVVKKRILGIWAVRGDTVVNDFKIEEDSIYYIDQEKYYKYFLTKEDTLIINVGGFLEKYKILIPHADTMIWVNTDMAKTYFIKSK
jgi:hypothetical protein